MHPREKDLDDLVGGLVYVNLNVSFPVGNSYIWIQRTFFGRLHSTIERGDKRYYVDDSPHIVDFPAEAVCSVTKKNKNIHIIQNIKT